MADARPEGATGAGGIHIDGPRWLGEIDMPQLGPGATDEVRMAWVVDVLDRQVHEKTGGPFAAAVFSGITGEVLGVAVNRVEPTATCIAHAELLALGQAGQRVGSFTLDGHGAVLVTSTEPCAMCLGAVVWAGLARVVCGATDRDAREIGFDEGDKPDHWRERLERRGIDVSQGVLRGRVSTTMHRYVQQGGLVYNADGH